MIGRASGSSSWINIAVIGPHQHGKSTLAGFLLYASRQIAAARINDAEQAAIKKKTPAENSLFFSTAKRESEKSLQTSAGERKNLPGGRWREKDGAIR